MATLLFLLLLSWNFMSYSMVEEEPILGQYNEETISILGYMNGQNFLSQGGADRIDLMLRDIDLSGKRLLDVGSGVGGPSFYIANKYTITIDGVDVDPQLITRAQENSLAYNISNIKFHLIQPNKLPFVDNSFDIIFSKEAIVHSRFKERLFKELYRVMKPNGRLIIMDWFKEKGASSQELNTTLEIDKLVMHYLTITEYCELLKESGFKNLVIQETSDLHLVDTKKDYERLHTEAEQFKTQFGEKIWQESLASWKAHIDILESKEVKTFLIHTNK